MSARFNPTHAVELSLSTCIYHVNRLQIPVAPIQIFLYPILSPRCPTMSRSAAATSTSSTAIDATLPLLHSTKRLLALPNLPPYATDLVRSIVREVRERDALVNSILDQYNASQGGESQGMFDSSPLYLSSVYTLWRPILRGDARQLSMRDRDSDANEAHSQASTPHKTLQQPAVSSSNT